MNEKELVAVTLIIIQYLLMSNTTDLYLFEHKNNIPPLALPLLLFLTAFEKITLNLFIKFWFKFGSDSNHVSAKHINSNSLRLILLLRKLNKLLGPPVLKNIALEDLWQVSYSEL